MATKLWKITITMEEERNQRRGWDDFERWAPMKEEAAWALIDA